MKHSPGFLKLVQKAKKLIRETTPAQVNSRLAKSQPFHLIDVREDDEWTQGRLPKALHLARGILERDIEKTVPDKNSEIVLYCGGGFRSALAAESLQKMGYKNVYSMKGGFRKWRALKLLIEGLDSSVGK